MVAAYPDGCFAGNGAHVHHQAIQRWWHDAPVLDAPLDRGAHCQTAGHSLTHTVRVNRHGADRIAAGHVWVFSSDIITRGGATPGLAVRVVDSKGRTLGTAHYSSSSQICLR